MVNALITVLVQVLPVLTFVFCVRLLLSIVIGAFRGGR